MNLVVIQDAKVGQNTVLQYCHYWYCKDQCPAIGIKKIQFYDKKRKAFQKTDLGIIDYIFKFNLTETLTLMLPHRDIFAFRTVCVHTSPLS